MTPERYSQVKSLFQLVLEQPRDQRGGFLERACGADRDLFNHVRALLQSDSTSDSFLETPAITPISKVLAEAEADMNEPMPTRIGPYAIQRIIGNGGMGAVYLANRADQTFDKQVAIKVIHKGLESDRILQRFRRERQIIASLDHPNIARLLDGGATADGRPYIVMEYIAGVPIDAWCDQRRLSIDRRLELFLQVCDAVHYAHQNLIIHRDIKPGNVLVTPDGKAKLLDFGIAKLINTEVSTAAAEKTATSMRLMTPQYASPEQVKGDPVTTASDVYLLGIVLYELLTGHRPYEAKDGTTLETARAFLTREPQLPSEAIFRTTERPGPGGVPQVVRNALMVSGQRDTNPTALNRRLRGEMDAILLRALRRDPAQRYQSTAQLADDIRHYLQHLPVSAVESTPAYRLRLLLERHRTAALAASTGLLLLCTVAVLAGWLAYSARKQQQIAQTRLAEVHKLTDAMLTEVDENLAPVPGTAPARQIVVDRTTRYLDSLAATVEGDIPLRISLAIGYRRVSQLQANPRLRSLGAFTPALRNLKKSAELFEALLQETDLSAVPNEYASTLASLANVLQDAGNPAAALPHAVRAAELRERAAAPPVTLSAAYQHTALVMAQLGRIAEAEHWRTKSESLLARFPDDREPRPRAAYFTRQAKILAQMGHLQEARESAREAIRLRDQLAMREPNSIRPKVELADILDGAASLGPAESGQPFATRAIRYRRELLATAPGNQDFRRKLAKSLILAGQQADGLEILHQNQAADPTHPIVHSDLVTALNTLAHTQIRSNQGDAAILTSRQLVESARAWVASQPAEPYAALALARAKLTLAQAALLGRAPELAAAESRSTITLLEPMLNADATNPAFLETRARAHWLQGRALHIQATTTGRWQTALRELELAASGIRELASAKHLAAEYKDAPSELERQITACQRQEPAP